MILVDTNIILRFLVEPKDEGEQRFREQASAVFFRASTEEGIFTTNLAVIAEVVFALTKGRHFQFDRPRVYELLIPVLGLPGCSIPEKPMLLNALRLWISHASISIVDAICLASSRESGNELMTFDAALKRVELRERRVPPQS